MINWLSDRNYAAVPGWLVMISVDLVASSLACTSMRAFPQNFKVANISRFIGRTLTTGFVPSSE
jgi:hypothetical protein